MNARADRIPNTAPAPLIARAEHISIEADGDATDTSVKQPHRITRMSYQLSSRLRGCLTELAILEGHYLGVRTVRPRCEPLKYQFDLRFLQTQPVRVRNIAWTWLVVALGLTAMGFGALFAGWSSPQAPWTTAVLGGASAILGAAGALFLFVRGTTESLEFRSAHGGVAFVSVTGGVGSARAGKRFFVELIKSINAAKQARAQSKAQFLRDEMREHHRLREMKVLDEEQYKVSKSRILASH